jgi:hypothetical protein
VTHSGAGLLNSVRQHTGLHWDQDSRRVLKRLLEVGGDQKLFTSVMPAVEGGNNIRRALYRWIERYNYTGVDHKNVFNFKIVISSPRLELFDQLKKQFEVHSTSF